MGIGVICALLSTIGWGFAYAYNQRLLAIYPFYILMLVESCVMMAAALGLSILKPQFVNQIYMNPPLYSFPWPVFLVAVVTVISKVLILFAIANIGASVAASMEITYPVFVVLFVYILFHQIPSPTFVLGIVLMMCGAGIILKSV